MKKLSLVVAVALGGLVACSIATAQEAGKDAAKKGKGAFVEQRLEQMKKALDLKEEQVPKVKAVLEEFGKKMREVPQDERREKGRAIREEETKKMKEILTEEQFKKYQEMSQRGGKKGGERKKGKKSE